MEPKEFDTRSSTELLKHMEKQNEVLREVYRSMLHELQKHQVEEEMLMRKLYEVMSAKGLNRMMRIPTFLMIVQELNTPIRKSMLNMMNHKDILLLYSLRLYFMPKLGGDE